MLADEVGYIGNLVGVFPNLLEQINECSGCDRLIHSIDDVGNCIPLLVAEIHSREAVQRHIYSLSFR